ncbi:MAG: nucleotidyltransferase domain-containing protein [Methanomicrobiales archaeon]
MDVQNGCTCSPPASHPGLKKRFGVANLGIFGSYIRREERPDSDVNVLVLFRNGEETFDN